MKKIFLFAILFFSVFIVNAQEIRGVTTGLHVLENNEWQLLQNGEGISVWINEDATCMTIKSTNPQYYYLYNPTDIHVNQSGHEQIVAQAVNKNGEACVIRFVFRDDIENADMQIYVIKSNLSWAYDIIIFPNE